jgi:hypothetical protein
MNESFEYNNKVSELIMLTIINKNQVNNDNLNALRLLFFNFEK